MNTISSLSYYLNLLSSYVSYYVTYYRSIYSDYPYEVKTAVWVIQWALIMIVVLTVLLERQGHVRRSREARKDRLEGQYGEALDFVFASPDRQVTRDEILSLFHVDDREVAKRGLLRDDKERRMLCRMVYDRLIHDASNGKALQRNIYLVLDIFALPAFLEAQVSLGSMRYKMLAMNMIRTFRLTVSPWVLNKLMNSKKVRVRRMAMYLSVMSSTDSELEYFETDFFDKNSCIYDEIELGYTLHRRRRAGLKLPNLAHWAQLQQNDQTKCMFVRLMRRFDQYEHCAQLTKLFMESKHKKLIEEISRTWGYLRYTDGEKMLTDAMLTQPDDTKVAIMHAVTRMATGQSLELLHDGYKNATNPHVRFEALRCMYSYGEEGRAMLAHLEQVAPAKDKKYFTFFHNPITLAKIPLDREQAYHPSVETVYNLSA